MIKRFTKFTIITVLFFTINLSIACFSKCPDVLGYYLDSIESNAMDVAVEPDGTTRFFYTDTLRSQVVFETIPYVSFAAKKPTVSLFNTAYGCDVGEVLNPIDPTQSAFYTDREIYFTSDRTQYIPAYTNFLSDDRMLGLLSFPSQLLHEEVARTTLVHQGLAFEKDDYTFYFKWVSSDGTALVDSVKVFMDL